MKNIESIDIILKSKKKKKNLIKELIILSIIFFFTATITIIGINLSTFQIFITDLLDKNPQKYNANHEFIILKTKSQLAKRFHKKKIKKIEIPHISKKEIQKLYINQKFLSTYLNQKRKKYKFNFNILPPDNKISISSLNIIAPIIDIKYASKEKIEKGDFDKELYKGVVKYPFTAYPGQTGNTLIFGHTSYYWWKKNPYGNIFAKIPKLKLGEKIQIIWNGKIYNYQIIEKKVIRPSQIEKLYNQYKNGKYLTLMGCYPIGTDLRRIIIIAKLSKQLNLSYNK